MSKKKKWILPLEGLTLVAARFKVLSEPIRLRILQQLENGRLSVNELTAAIGTTQPNVSKHLKLLQDAGIIARKQEGNTAFYSVADETVFALCDVVCGSLKEEFSGRSAMFD